MKISYTKNIMLSDAFNQIQRSIVLRNLNTSSKQLPALWLFTDEKRIPDLENLLYIIPKNLKVGVVFRYYNHQSRYKYSKRILRVCKQKKFLLLIGSDLGLCNSIGADGVHFPRWEKKYKKYPGKIISCSFHKLGDIRRCKNIDADIIFISPVFKTASYITKNPLGIIRSSLMLNYLSTNCAALGGINLKNIKRFSGTNFSAIGAIDLFCS